MNIGGPHEVLPPHGYVARQLYRHLPRAESLA